MPVSDVTMRDPETAAPDRQTQCKKTRRIVGDSTTEVTAQDSIQSQYTVFSTANALVVKHVECLPLM